jgi:hypothetical protein
MGGICGGKPLGSCLGKVLIGGPWFGGGGKKFIYNLYKYLNYIYHCISKYNDKFCIIKINLLVIGFINCNFLSNFFKNFCVIRIIIRTNSLNHYV